MKLRYLFIFIWLLIRFSINAQETYTEFLEKAITIIDSEDAKNYKTAANLIEKAFNKHTDSINGTGLYYASVLYATLKNNDKAFKYLTPLAKMETDEDGYPGWSYVLDEYAQDDYKNLMTDKRWTILKKRASIAKAHFFEQLNKTQKEFFTTSAIDLNSIKNKKKLYRAIKNFQPFIAKEKQDYSITFAINDSINNSYLVHLPKNYNSKKAYPVLFFLNGAVRFSSLKDYHIAKEDLSGWNRFYTKYASQNDVILVFPSADKKYNWMFPDDGFFMIPKIVKQLKKAINIDDNKVFVSGHSNGATGSFSYLIKQPNQFAGFYGFNTEPKVYTGGTFIENISNRSFINFSTDQDYYYPPNANNSLDSLTKALHLDYKDYRYKGFPHWFPEFDESEPAYKILFADLMKRQRNPFPKKINWEFDTDKKGAIDWLTAIKLDTLSPKKSWHKNLNFDINKWMKYKNDSLITAMVNKKAFDFPRKSGKIIAVYDNNVFRIKTSAIKSFKINISPEMVNVKKKVQVYINDTLYYNQKVKYNKIFMLSNFYQNQDRKQVWINQIKLIVN